MVKAGVDKWPESEWWVNNAILRGLRLLGSLSEFISQLEQIYTIMSFHFNAPHMTYVCVM